MPVTPYASSGVPITSGLPVFRPDPNRNRDLLNNVIDPAMEPDAGMSAMAPRDPYMASLPPARSGPSAAAMRSYGGDPNMRPEDDPWMMERSSPAIDLRKSPVTTLQPSRTAAFSRADAQALHALDPRALEEARGVAALPESTPAKMTGSFGGKSFEMQPSARVDRNALAKLYAAAQERKGQERQDSVRAQEQGGKLALVEAPGKQLTDRRKMELEAEERITGKKLEADAPGRAADIAAKNAQTAAVTGGETRAQAQAARQKTPEQEAIDTALAEAQASPFAQTPEGRARIAALAKRSTTGQAVPESAEGVAGPGPDIGQATAEIMADPGIAAIIARVKETTPGVFTGSQGRQTGAAARQLAERAIRARLARSGVSPDEAQQVITSILGATSGPAASASPSTPSSGFIPDSAGQAVDRATAIPFTPQWLARKVSGL